LNMKMAYYRLAAILGERTVPVGRLGSADI
jgi:hypothetical protein